MRLFQGLAGEIGDMVSRLAISSKEKRELEAEVTRMVCRYAGELTHLQADIVQRETGGNWLQRSWRPLVMLAFAAIVLLGAFMEIPYLDDDSRFWNLVEFGLGGYVVGRGIEGVGSLFHSKGRRRHG